MNGTGFPKDKILRITVFLLFVVLFAGSIYYYKERMLFCDAPHIFFLIANSHHLELSYVHRYGAFITQIVPLFSSLAHVPLKEALMLYSMSFNLFYLIVAAVLLFRFKNTKLGILFALYYILFASETYYWTNNEVHQAIAWCFLLFGIIQNYKQRPRYPVFHFSVVIVLSFLSLFTHPLMLFIFPFLWIFTILEKELNPYNKKQILILSLVFLAICCLKYSFMNANGYDAGKIQGATHLSFQSLKNVLHSPMAKAITDKLIKDYFFVPILFFAGLIAAILKKKYRQLALVFLFAIPDFGAVCITYADFLTFYIESEWMPFSIITSILFVYYFAPYVNAKWITVLLLIVFSVRINLIARAAKKFEIRNEWTSSVINKMKQQGIYKGYVYMDDSLQKVLLLNWGGPVESIMTSALMGEKLQRTFIVDTKEVIRQRMVQSKDSLIGPFTDYSYKELNPVYFKIDTTQQYQPIH